MLAHGTDGRSGHRAAAADVMRGKPDKSVTVGFMEPVAVLRLTDDAATAALAREFECVRDHLVDGWTGRSIDCVGRSGRKQ
jgi:hypothetical protein